MSIRREDVRYVADLARLELSAAEEEALVAELGAILGYVEKLAELDTEGVPATAHVHDVGTPLRDDVIGNAPNVEALLDNAPERWEGFFRVPKIIE
ncbi:MAG: Asp-tRNA(Asn)/Glu-tRNA(Gln) amidotransferase subunit GatC [Deltaproteobacteria bacterium]|nr:Asp-tRNA(Asn)/Glu-tRNA(Gln) amidotransferase subunit GatC [Deltaproteobacteria bacterium]